MEERPNSFNFALNLKPYNQHRNRRIFRPIIVLGDKYKKQTRIKHLQIFKKRNPLLKATVSTAINANSHQSAWLQEGKSLPNPDQGRGGLGSKGVITSRQITQIEHNTANAFWLSICADTLVTFKEQSIGRVRDSFGV